VKAKLDMLVVALRDSYDPEDGDEQHEAFQRAFGYATAKRRTGRGRDVSARQAYEGMLAEIEQEEAQRDAEGSRGDDLSAMFASIYGNQKGALMTGEPEWVEGEVIEETP